MADSTQVIAAPEQNIPIPDGTQPAGQEAVAGQDGNPTGQESLDDFQDLGFQDFDPEEFKGLALSEDEPFWGN